MGIVMRSSCLILNVVLMLIGAIVHAQDLPALPIAPEAEPPAEQQETGGELAAPTADNPEATAAEATGPIAVDAPVSDRQLQQRLAQLLPKYPGVRSVQVEVEDGVVTLTGHVEDDAVRTRLRDFVRRVQGVHLVLNQTKTDAQVLSAWQLAEQQLAGFWAVLSQKWLLGLLALVTLMVSLVLARFFWHFADRLLAPFSRNLLLRSVLGSVLGGLIIGGGFLLALRILGLTETVLPGLGLAGVVALALGFAFRDIAENFISSILLGARRPFRAGDYIVVAGHEGVVKSLNTRATILVTLEGHQVRIPNAKVFKEIVVNRTASSSIQAHFDVLIPYEVSTVAAQEAVTRALRAHDGVLAEPPARVLIEALESGAVRLRVYFWFAARGIDGFKLLSDVRLRVKVALQLAGITPPPSAVSLSLADAVPVTLAQTKDQAPMVKPEQAATRQAMSRDQVQANLMHDTQVAETSSAKAPDAQNDLIGHVLHVADAEVSEEGENLLGKRKP
jgi:small conductance mechanosensitive channel